jgi:class 3 adenylate cyclase/pimeloyl-ACP methyl ester carboxylesterase
MGSRQTRYVQTVDGFHIAYQVVGDGAPDIAYTPGFISNIDTAWDEGGHGELFRRLAALGRLIVFDRRGTGLSDRPDRAESLALELGLNDLRAVLDASGSDRPVLFGYEDGGTLAAMFAAAHPDRVSGLILFSPWVKGRRSRDYPWAWSEEEQQDWDRRVEQGWGSEPFVRWLLSVEAPDPPVDTSYVDAFARYIRSCASPGTVLAIEKMQAEIDARPILPTISVPTLTLRRQNPVRSSEEVRYITDMIPGAHLIELSGNEQLPFLGDIDELVRTIEMFINGISDEQQEFDRFLATVLFTDVVGSTAQAARIGDRSWKRLIERHDAIVRAMVTRYQGSVIDTAGDGFFATFDGPARAVKCAQQIIDSLGPTGLQIRAGVHTGEVQMIDGKIGGLSVVIGARVGALAGPSEILVSQTVKDLVAGSGLAFEDAGERELKGVPDRWRVHRVKTS